MHMTVLSHVHAVARQLSCHAVVHCHSMVSFHPALGSNGTLVVFCLMSRFPVLHVAQLPYLASHFSKAACYLGLSFQPELAYMLHFGVIISLCGTLVPRVSFHAPLAGPC
jgi:hypothetical protein